ncbi:MAG: glycosyltransferase [Acidobacteria bacterium]|nr:MAG: glycosyltransferase [Acidobacteriota bacterium]
MELSIIVPTLNEAETLAGTLEAAPPGAELIVSDGGSADETVSIAERHGARVVTGERGRAPQMNRGAEAAAGDVLLFVHADCLLGPDARDNIVLALEDKKTVGGAFSLRIRDAGWSLKLIAATSNFRARHLGTPYGDQGLFVRKSAFDQVGGYPELPFMEDVALVRELGKIGKLVQLKAPITTGRRHWQKLGPLATTLLNWSMVLLYTIGVPAGTLAPYYRKLRNESARSSSESAWTAP